MLVLAFQFSCSDPSTNLEAPQKDIVHLGLQGDKTDTFPHPALACGMARFARNAYNGGDWPVLRNLSKVVNAECRQARELVDKVRPGSR